MAESAEVSRPVGRIRWTICILLFSAVVLNYVDRLVLSILKPSLQQEYGWTEEGYASIAIWFQAVYGIGYIFFGRFIDKVGTKIGYAVAMSMWTIGHMAQTLVTSTAALAVVRLPLALGESGAYPASLSAVAEWFPKRERALAIGIFGAGAHIGAVVTPLVIPAIVLALGWRAGFWITGALNIVWLIAWLYFYKKPRQHPRVTTDELAYIESDPPLEQKRVSFLSMFRFRQTWAYLSGRFLLDPVWWLFIFWLPDFFSRQFNVALKDFGPPIVAVYLMADLGAIGAGWASSHMLAKGHSANFARKMTMLGCSICALPICLAPHAPSLWVAVGLLGLAAFGTQGYSTNLFTMPSDLFPKWAQGTIVGLGGFAGAVGGMLMARFAGWVLASTGSYVPMFLYCALAFPFTLLIFHLLNRKYAPVETGAL
ncbi:MFS transporter [Sphingobium sp. H39-3-25]|nr:MFS transporter [Sphingobium arseniciresistens]